MKAEREKGTYAEHDHDGHDSDRSEPADSGSRRDCAESTRTVSSAKTEDLATPLTSPSNSPPPKALFLPSKLSQPLQGQFPDSNPTFYQTFYDRQNSNLLAMPTSQPFVYNDESSLSWLDSVTLDDSYDLTLPNSDFTLMNL